jgi:hypothetical protein
MQAIECVSLKGDVVPLTCGCEFVPCVHAGLSAGTRPDLQLGTGCIDTCNRKLFAPAAVGVRVGLGREDVVAIRDEQAHIVVARNAELKDESMQGSGLV